MLGMQQIIRSFLSSYHEEVNINTIIITRTMTDVEGIRSLNPTNTSMLQY